MDQQAERENIEIQRNEDDIGNISANTRQENSSNDQGNLQGIQLSLVHPSDSDVLMNKSDSDDGLFVTDSSDDVMNDVLSDFSPAKDRMEQTRETIMESLVQSFVSITPNNQNSLRAPNETANERISTNDENVFDAIDMVSVQKDMQSLQSMTPMRRIPSDSAFPDFRRNVSDLASIAASEEYVTVGSASEEPTTVSFFSQSASTSQLQAVTKPGSYGRSKSASSFRRNQRTDKDESHSVSAQPASDTTTDHWLLDDGWLRKSSSDLQQTRQEASSDFEKANTASEEKLEKEENYADSTHPMPESGTCDAGSQPNQESTPQARSNSAKPTFKATKLPRFYRTRSDAKMASSRSESCVIPNENPIAKDNMTVRRSRSSNMRYSRSLMARSTTNERCNRKDAGGVSYAVKHCVSPERTSAKQCSVSYKVRPPVATRSPDREKSTSSHAPIQAATSGSYSKPGSTRNTEDSARHKQKERTTPHLNISDTYSSKPNETNHPDKVRDVLKNIESTSNDKNWSSSVTGHPTPAGSKLPQRARPGSPMKVIKIRSTAGLKTAKSYPEHCAVRPNSDGAAALKRTASSSSKILLKRPTPSLRSNTSSFPVTSALTGAENAAVSVSSGPIDQSSVETGAGRRDSAETPPTLMSLKVDVSVRAEDGSVHSFRDISPPRDGRTGDLFSGVEEFIRGLLQGPMAAGGHGRPLTTTPVSAFSPRSVTPRSPSRGGEVTSADRGEVLGARPAAAPSATTRRSGEAGGEFSGRHDRSALDMYAQRLRAEESVLLLTSTGSMSSTDVWPQAARQIVYPSTTIPAISVATKRPKRGQPSPTICPIVNQPGEENKDEDEETLKSDWRKHYCSQVEVEAAERYATVSEPYQCHSSVSPDRSAPLTPPSSPVRMKSAPSSPERGRTPSPCLPIPVPKRMLSESAVRASRSPTPERHSFYHTAQTTPERPRSTTPDSLCSAGGSSGSLHSLKRSPRVAELQNFGTLSPFRASSSASDKRTNCGRSHSSSPRSARSSPQRHSPFSHLRHSSQYNKMPERFSPVRVLNETFVCSGKTADGDTFWTKRPPGSVLLSPQGVKPVHGGAKIADDSTTDIEPITSSSGVHSQGTSSGECAQIRHDSERTAGISLPTPMKRSISGPFVYQQDASVQKPIPQKRTRNISPVRPGTPHPRHEEPMISSKTSFCSMDSPMRNRSPSPHEAQAVIPTVETDGNRSGEQYPAEMEISAVEASAKQEIIEGKAELPNFGTLIPIEINSPASGKGSSSSLSHSASPRSARSNPSSHHSTDHMKAVIKPDRQEQQQQRRQQVNGDGGVVTSSLEREMIETENTVRLMEETISVLERQNNSLVTNTREISEKIYEERSRRCDLKTAKLMLQKVRMELQKTSKHSEENRMQLLNANEKMSEQESAIFLLKESLREECIKNVRMERCLRQRPSASEENSASQRLSQLSEVDRREQTASSLLAEPSSVRELLEETETLLQEERRARKDVEEKLAQERSRKLIILNAAKKWRQQLETGTKPAGLGIKSLDWDSKNVMFPRVSDSDSSNMKSYQSIHTPGNSNESIKIDPIKCKSDESILSGQKFDIESVSGSEYFSPDLTDKQDSACQCEILDGLFNWKIKYDEVKQISDLYLRKMNEVSHDRMELRSQLQLANCKLKEETQKKDRFEQELKNLIDRIHEMQRDVQLYQKQSKEQLATIKQGDHERIEDLEMEKLKLKDYYQQQMETIVQEKVAEFQGKVGHLETIVREQINTYTKSMQHKFREKLATASLQQKEVISRLEGEHSKEVERLNAEYPQEIERLQQRLAECRQEVIDKKNRLEQRETQVGTILRVVKLLIREGNAMKGDTTEQNTVEIARKILRCMDLNLDDITSPRPRLVDCKEQEGDREYVTKDGSCVTFRSIPDSPRPMLAGQATQSRSAPPVPPRRKTPTNGYGQNATTLTQKNSDVSTTSQPFHVFGVVKKKMPYTRFGDEVIRAKSEEFLQNNLKTQTKQLYTVSDLSQWGDSGSWTLDGVPPAAPPPTPPSVTTSGGTITDEPDLLSKDSAQDVASSVLKELNHPARVKTVADKGTGSATSLIRDPSFLLLTNSILAEDAAQMCQCKRLQLAMEEYGRLKMTIAHRNRLKEGPPGRERTRSSSETSIVRLAGSYFETIEGGGVFETKQLGSSKINVSSLTSSELQSSKTQADGSKTASKASSDSNQLFSKGMRTSLAARAIETGGKFANPFSMKPIPSRRINGASEKITSKPPIQNASASPSRSATGRSLSPVRQDKTAEGATGITSGQPEVTRSRSRQDATDKTGFVERTISPSRNIVGRARKTSPTLKRMPSFDKVDMLDCKESSEDSKFALPRRPPPLELKPRDNRASVQRKQLAAMRKQSPRENERHHSISPRERKLFTLRSQQHAEKKITRTEVTKRTLSPAPVSPLASFPTAAAPGPTRSFVPTFKPQRHRSRSGRRSASSSMDWKKYIKSGQPWQDVYLHEHNDPDYVEPIPTNGTYYTAEARNEDSDRSDWSPSYSWAPPRRGERDKWNRYLTTGQAAEQIALERFYATPERESVDARRRMRRSRKQAEVLDHINRLLAVSSGSDPSEERAGRRAERGGRRARSQQRQALDPAWQAPTEHQHGRSAVLDGVRRKALNHLGARHPADPLMDLPAYRPPSDHGGSHQHQRASLSLDRDLPMPRRDCSVHQRLSSDIKTHQRLSREYGKQRRHSSAQERSPSQQRWPSDSRRKAPLVLVSRMPRGELAPPERRNHSHSRYGTGASALDNLDMDSWVDQWERKWDHERKQRPLVQRPPT